MTEPERSASIRELQDIARGIGAFIDLIAEPDFVEWEWEMGQR